MKGEFSFRRREEEETEVIICFFTPDLESLSVFTDVNVFLSL